MFSKIEQHKKVLLFAVMCFTFICVSCAIAQEKRVFNYDQKAINRDKVTQKNIKMKVAVSRFEEAVDVAGSPFTEKMAEDNKDSKVNIVDSAVKINSNTILPDEEVSKREMLTGLLVDSLRKSEVFDVVEREEINHIIREINFQDSDWVKQDDVNKLGHISSVRGVVTGELLRNRAGDRVGAGFYTVSLRLYNVNTGNIISSSVSSANYLQDAVSDAVRQLSEEIKGEPWACKIVNIEGKQVYINAGDDDNLEKNNTFRIVRKGKKIRDPETDQILGFEEEEIGVIKVTEVVNANLSKAVVTKKTDEIRIGDLVVSKRIDAKSKKKSSLWKETFEKSSIKTDSLKDISKASLEKNSMVNMGVEDIVARYGKSIVLVQAGNAMGSGFVVSPDGYVLTNSHVVQGNSVATIKMIQENKVYPNVAIVKDNPIRDIALLKIDTADSLTPVELGDSESVKEGERVVALGNPQGFENTVSDGLISSIRDLNGTKVLQTSAPISKGSSGGPLFNLQGQVIGITTLTSTEGQNLNFAIAINYAKDELLQW